MAEQLVISEQASRDVEALLALEKAQIAEVLDLFTPADATPQSKPDFLEKVIERLKSDPKTANSAVVVAKFLLSIVAVEKNGSAPPEPTRPAKEVVVEADVLEPLKYNWTEDDYIVSEAVRTYLAQTDAYP